MKKIKILYLRVNTYCNAHCFMCDFWKNTQDEITEEQFENILDAAEHLKMIRFTGGEPLLCKKLPHYISKCNSKGIKTSIITNGLILDEKIDELVKNGLDQIIVSLDGSISKLHDILRGTRGLFEKIDKIFERIQKDYPFLHTRINTVVSEKNLSDLPNIAQWIDKHNIKQWSIIPIKLYKHRWADIKSLEELKKEYFQFKKSIENCKVEMMGYSADWAGNVDDFWSGNYYIRPRGKCHLTNIVAFYDPFKEHIYPCNCIPHRSVPFRNREEEKEWYYKNGCKYCTGCEPLNAYCSDFPEKIIENIFNF